MQIQRKFFTSVRLGLDAFILILTFILILLTVSGISFDKLTGYNFSLLFVLLVVWYFSAQITDLYDDFRSRNYSYELIILAKNIFFQIIVAVIVLFLLNENTISRKFVFTYGLGLFVSLGIQKYLLRRILYLMRKKGRNIRNLLIVGAGEIGKNFFEVINRNPQFGYKIVGFLDDYKWPYLNGEYLGKINQLESILSKEKVDNVVITLANGNTARIEEVIRICDNNTIRSIIIPDYFKFVSNKYNVSMFGRFPVINVREDRVSEIHWRLAKRIFDIVFSIVIIISVFSWLFPFIALALKLNSPGPVFFKQERWGKDNRKFSAYKFRSMIVQSKNVDDGGKFCQAIQNDPRITKVGKILRKTNLDELPQFFNVLKGEMSIVGPRPHPTPLNVESKDKVDLYMVRHLVNPGITGWAQVNGLRGETKNIILMQKRVGYDLWYIENWSIWLDIQIIFLTVWRMVVGDPNAY